jgi:hypothetical protein
VDAVIGQGTQRVDAEDHLLQRAAGEPADDEQVKRVEDCSFRAANVGVLALADAGS